MQHFMTSAHIPLRPLLYVGGASVTAAVCYYLFKMRGDGEKEGENEDTRVTEVQPVSLLNPALMCDDATQTDSAVHEVTLVEAEEKHKQAKESTDELQQQNADLMSQVETLQNTVQELGNLLAETHTECNDTRRLYETELNLRKYLQSDYERKEEKFTQEINSLRECELQKRELRNLHSKRNETEQMSQEEYEREREGHSVLKFDQMTSTHNEEILQDVQAKATRLYGEVTESHDHLKRDEYELKLRESVQKMERELSESHRKYEEIKREYEREKEAHSVLKVNQKTSTHHKWLLQVSQAEAEENYQSTAQMQNKNSDLMSQVKTLQNTVQGLSSLLAETRKKCETAKEEHKVVNGILQFVETKARKREKFLLRKRKAIQESLDEAEENYREAMDRVTELENENIDRVAEVHTLQDEMTHLVQNLSDTQMMFERTMRDLEQKSRQFTELKSKWELLNETVLKDYQVECQAHKVLKVQYSEMKEQHNKLHEWVVQVKQQDRVRVSEDYSILQAQYEELKQHHGSLMVSVAEEKYALLYSKKSDLISHVNKEHLGEELTETHRKCDEISRREREDYNLLKVQYKEMEETLQQCQELLKKQCLDLGAEVP
ncbi:putative leucine-rich repeat-containing protein DDB_G0290503 isoform X4 [Tachysurus fulvidraco]|uniref:putative leucine-rich repeat-containing protein DDB_G0290503 isoform X4 n=1 Tax=Tachysurus fulvidraco TaxID=1234273 RepID=UPI001FEDE496|nr:putative leucine-rich repeat-containing protein DDB_G0290503 isoform X4 [Tachysurus fulvidraco]